MSGAKPSVDNYSGKEAFGLFSNIKLEIYSLFALASLGIFFKMFVIQKNDMTGNAGPATNTLWGYGLSSICILCILFIIYGLDGNNMSSKNFKGNTNDGYIRNTIYILSQGTILLLVLIVMILILVLNYIYYQKINIGVIPYSFNKFNYISDLLMIVQFIILFQYINIKVFKGKDNNVISNIITSSTYLLTTLNIIIIILMYILLKYYSTDG